MTPNEFTMIRAREAVTIITAAGGIQEGNVVSATATEVTVEIKGQRYTFNRSHAHRTRFNRLVIDEAVR